MAMIMGALAGVASAFTAGVSALGGPLAALATGVSAAGSVIGGVRANQAAKVEAKAMQQKGDQEVALAQRRAWEARKQKDLALGRLKAVSAASGGGTGGTVVDLATGIEQRGEYNALMDMYSGMTARNDLYNDAAMTRYEGKSSLIGGLIKGASTVYGDYSEAARQKKLYQYEYQK